MINAEPYMQLSYVNTGDEGASAIAEALRGCPNIEQLDLAWNGIGPAGARCLPQFAPFPNFKGEFGPPSSICPCYFGGGQIEISEGG